MDREQEEMQFLGLFDIYVESYKLIHKHHKIFTKITLSLVLPLAIIMLAHREVSQLLFSNLRHTEFQLRHTRPGSARYDRISDHISGELAIIVLFKLAYLTFLLILSLLSTSAVVYTVACAYTSRDISFPKIMSIVPRVWRRLMVTFLSIFLVFMVYNVLAFIAFVAWIFLALTFQNDLIGRVLFVFGIISYVVGSVYMSVIWQLANTVSVLEDSHGFKAMGKSRELIRGKMGLALVFFVIVHFALGVTNVIFKKLVVDESRIGLAGRVGFGVLCVLVLFVLIVFGLVGETVIYFVCKSYHHENIDKNALSDHLEVYSGEYVPLKSKDVQMEDYQV